MLSLVKFCDIEQEIIGHIKEKRIIPFIGAGFSANCQAKNGAVPSGSSMKEYMIKIVKEFTPDSPMLNGDMNFSRISILYNRIVPASRKRDYILEHFSDVRIDALRRSFLNIDWLYIYTINIDDSIEKNSNYTQVVDSNHDVNFSILAEKKCVIKLHGDVNGCLTYKDYQGQIFDSKQYALSIKKNRSLLTHLKHDFNHNNLLFIGCSLEDEFDVSSLELSNGDDTFGSSSRYYMTTTAPDYLKQIELAEYGITHVCVFETFDDIYKVLIDASETAHCLSADAIDLYKSYTINHVPPGFENNNGYIFHGKSLIEEKSRKLFIPSFFVVRHLVSTILKNLNLAPIHIVDGMPVSGKTYLLVAIKQQINNRDVYLFGSRTTLNQESVTLILNKRNSVLLFDTNSLSKDQINRSDKDIASVINTQQDSNLTVGYSLYSRLFDNELDILNSNLALCELPQFNKNKTLIDNLVSLEKKFYINGKFSRVEPSFKTVDDLVVLILLAVKDKLYTYELVNYDIEHAAYHQVTVSAPFITYEHNMFYEKDIDNPSDHKIVINGKYWLLESLGEYAKIKPNHIPIVEAFRKIVKISVDTFRNKKFYGVLDFIKYDVINALFPSDFKGQIGLIRKIYDGIQEYVVCIPSYYYHYYHQRAKAYWWQNRYDTAHIDQLFEAKRFLSLAIVCIQNEMEHSASEKILNTHAHILFTNCLVCSRIAILNNYEHARSNSEALSAISDAINNAYNFDAFRSEDIKDINDVVNNLGSRPLEQSDGMTLQQIINYLHYNRKNAK